MNADSQPKQRKNVDFWRACRYLAPHRGTMIVSILCALVVGAAFTGGLGTMLPIMQVLIRGDSVQGWTNRKIVENRLGVRLADRADRCRCSSSKRKTAPPPGPD